MILYLEQEAWGACDHTLKEYPPLSKEGKYYLDLVRRFGVGGEFNWNNLKAFCKLMGLYLSICELEFFRSACVSYSNAITLYSSPDNDSLPPPYMSKEYKERRAQAQRVVNSGR